MASSIRMRATRQDGITEVKALIRHPMETGLRKDPTGATIPAKYITQVTATHGERVVMLAHWGPAVSRNPFLGFRFSGAAAGETVVVTWIDNQGETDSSDTTIR